MPDVYVIMGDKNTRKSSTIRALTGVYNKGVYEIAIQGGQVIDVFVQISSLQESGISPQEFIKETKNYQHILLSLWILSGNGQPDGLTYIQDFINAGWDIREIVVLGMNNLPYNLPTNAPKPKYIQNSINLPANQIASQIRNWWKWF